MSRNRVIFTHLIIPLFLFAQDIDEAIRLFNSFQFSRSKETFKEIIKNEDNPRIAEAYYYLGRLSISPDSALFYYGKVINDYPQCRYADISYLEVAKVNIARKNYQNAIVTLNELLRRFPDADFKDETLFWLGVSYFGIEDAKKGTGVFEELKKSHPKSVWSERATNIIPLEKATQAYYTIQLGSYRDKNNADRYAETLKNKGVDVRIVEAYVKDNKYYRIWTGQFVTLERAKEYLVKLDSLGIKGNVVKGF